MFANGVEHTTTTTGTGALSLVAVSGKPTYANVFGSTGTRVVSYTILDASDVPIEGGKGTVTLSTLSLARGEVQFTWDGTDYKVHGAASALSLASGTKKVISSAMADDFLPALHVAGTMGDNIGVAPFCAVQNTVNYGTANGRVEYVPILIPMGRRVSRVSVRVGTGYTGGTSSCRVALYDLGSDGRPAARIADFGDLGAITAATLTSSALGTPVYVPAGWYVVAILPQYTGGSGTPVFTAWNAPFTCGPFGVSFGSGLRVNTVGTVTGQTALNDPATLTSISYLASAIPVVAFD